MPNGNNRPSRRANRKTPQNRINVHSDLKAAGVHIGWFKDFLADSNLNADVAQSTPERRSDIITLWKAQRLEFRTGKEEVRTDRVLERAVRKVEQKEADTKASGARSAIAELIGEPAYACVSRANYGVSVLGVFVADALDVLEAIPEAKRSSDTFVEALGKLEALHKGLRNILKSLDVTITVTKEPLEFKQICRNLNVPSHLGDKVEAGIGTAADEGCEVSDLIKQLTILRETGPFERVEKAEKNVPDEALIAQDAQEGSRARSEA